MGTERVRTCWALWTILSADTSDPRMRWISVGVDTSTSMPVERMLLLHTPGTDDGSPTPITHPQDNQ